jgi:Tfp pilus assembly protein FimV
MIFRIVNTTLVLSLLLFLTVNANAATATATVTRKINRHLQGGGPQNDDDDLYFCEDPSDETNVLECDEETNRWNTDLLEPEQNIDESQVCVELTEILVDARGDVPLYQEIMDTVVTDKLKPCILWATLYGPLSPDDNMKEEEEEEGDSTTVPEQEGT